MNNEWVMQRASLATGIKGKRIIVQGYGSVGYWAAKNLVLKGAILIGVADSGGAIIREEGIDPLELLEFKKKNASVYGFKKLDKNGMIDEKLSKLGDYDIKGKEGAVKLLGTKADVMILAAFQQQIHIGNVQDVKARLILEAANGPVTALAQQKLDEMGIMVVPDVVASSGGVTVSYFEWLKSLSNVKFGRMTRKWEEASKRKMLDVWEGIAGEEIKPDTRIEVEAGPSEREIVLSALSDTIQAASEETIETAQTHNCNLRTAAYINAIRKIMSTQETSGIL